SFARQIARIEAGALEPRLLVGNLEPRRDLTDVRDAALAFAMSLALPPGGRYNVCSGRSASLRDILDILLRLSEVRADVEVARDRVRPNEIPVVLGDPSRLGRASGWSARIPLERSLSDTLSWWRTRERAPPRRPP